MGNKQKNKKYNNQKNKNINQKVYLLCPNCFKQIPLINTFIDNDTLYIKISCSCLPENNYLIIPLLDYLSTINNRTNSNFCLFHPDKIADFFCMNCENWLCQECLDKHTKEICDNEYNKNNKNKGNIYCKKHEDNKIYFCKKCIIIFCKKCFIHHNTRNIIKHKGTNIEYYLTEDKIKAKYSQFQTYLNDVIELTNVLKDELLKDINLAEKNKNIIINSQKEHFDDKNKFQDKYLIHKSINEQLKFLIELILNNCEYFQTEKILNRKFIYNIIINTKINKKYPRLNKTLPILNQMKYFTNFLKSNYINKIQNYEFNLINKKENSNEK